ncbi:winged helix-turn-helix domain-containing protein [Streptomyces sp. AD2-2]|nr:winged helix-turn-helix domain-containing protein [Streptomyces sp. AD2-2]
MPPKNTQPKYRQIADYLREGILNGTFPAGQPLPSEEALAKQFGVTRPTVRQGLTELRASGLVEAIMGRGTFARSPRAAQASRARAAYAWPPTAGTWRPTASSGRTPSPR